MLKMKKICIGYLQDTRKYGIYFKPEAIVRGLGNIFHISEYLGDILFIPQHISEHFLRPWFLKQLSNFPLNKSKIMILFLHKRVLSVIDAQVQANCVPVALEKTQYIWTLKLDVLANF